MPTLSVPKHERDLMGTHMMLYNMCCCTKAAPLPGATLCTSKCRGTRRRSGTTLLLAAGTAHCTAACHATDHVHAHSQQLPGGCHGHGCVMTCSSKVMLHSHMQRVHDAHTATRSRYMTQCVTRHPILACCVYCGCQLFGTASHGRPRSACALTWQLRLLAAATCHTHSA
jgi:hypothetical protein